MALALVALLPMGMSMGDGTPPGDTSEADDCAGCHFYPGTAVMPAMVDQWEESNHANSNHGYNANTYCAECHSPFQADPAATHSENEPVPIEEWQGVTCGACHPPHDLRVEWGTPIGNYDIEAEDWIPRYEEDANALCEYCHTGSRHEKEFQGYGSIMDKKDVTCVDCHMAKAPTDPAYGDYTNRHSHTFEVDPEFSCGLDNEDCHDNHNLNWAEKQVQKGIHEKGSYGQDKDKEK
jgi:hypothetical protein